MTSYTSLCLSWSLVYSQLPHMCVLDSLKCNFTLQSLFRFFNLYIEICRFVGELICLFSSVIISQNDTNRCPYVFFILLLFVINLRRLLLLCAFGRKLSVVP